MRISPVLGAGLLALGISTAQAAPASVTVAIGPKLQEKAARTYGVGEIEQLARDLGASVSRSLARTGAYDDARIELTLVDAVPNRPTFKETSDRPGLSMQSFGVGGAKIEGRAVTADGKAVPLSYSFYETDIRQAPFRATWSDAQETFDRFAARLGRGEAVARR